MWGSQSRHQTETVEMKRLRYDSGSGNPRIGQLALKLLF